MQKRRNTDLDKNRHHAVPQSHQDHAGNHVSEQTQGKGDRIGDLADQVDGEQDGKRLEQACKMPELPVLDTLVVYDQERKNMLQNRMNRKIVPM